MELLLMILIFILSPLETFMKIENLGSISKVIGIILFVLFFLKAFRNKKLVIPHEGIILLVFIFIGLCSSLWAENTEVAIGRSLTLIQFFFLYLITFNLLKGKKQKVFDNMYFIFIMFGMFLALYEIFQLYILGSVNAWTRISISDEVDVNHLAAFLTVPFLLGIYYTNHKSLKFLTPTIIILVGILLTQSRGAILTLLITLGIYLLLNFKKGSFKFRYLFIITSSFILIYNIIPKEFLFRINLMFTNKEVLLSGSGRNAIWDVAWDLFKENPVAGIGLGNFSSSFRPPHSSFFQLISELGLLGFCTFIIFLLFLFYIKKKNRDGKMRIELLLLIALLIMSLTVDIFYQKYLWVLFGIYSSTKTTRFKNIRHLDSTEHK